MAQIENADPTAPVFHARALRKIYGAGEAEVCALDGITLDCHFHTSIQDNIGKSG
jgi:hypothetical protein